MIAKKLESKNDQAIKSLKTKNKDKVKRTNRQKENKGEKRSYQSKGDRFIIISLLSFIIIVIIFTFCSSMLSRLY